MNQKAFVAGGMFGEEMLMDETDPKATKSIKKFLDDYRRICDEHKCMLFARELEDEHGEPLIEAVYNPDVSWRHAEHKDIVDSTKSRGWQL